MEPGVLTKARRAPPTGALRPLRTPLAFEPSRHGSWAPVWGLALARGVLLVWIVSAAARGDRPWTEAPVGCALLAVALLLPVLTRIAMIRVGLAPTVDERFSWHDFPERRAAYEAEVASRKPAWIRNLERAVWPLGVAGWVLLRTGDLALGLRHLVS